MIRTDGVQLDPSQLSAVDPLVLQNSVTLEGGDLVINQVSTPSAPTAALRAVAGNLTGAYTWKVTYTTVLGETLPSAASNQISPAGQQATITLPISASPAVTGRKLYRTVAGPGADWKLVATIANNTAASYIDNIADGALGANAPTTNTTGRLRVNGGPTELVTSVSTGTVDVDVTNTTYGVQILQQGAGVALRLGDANFYSSLKVGTQAANLSYTLPTSQGAALSLLSNDGSGTLSWAAATGTGSVVRTTSPVLSGNIGLFGNAIDATKLVNADYTTADTANHLYGWWSIVKRTAAANKNTRAVEGVADYGSTGTMTSGSMEGVRGVCQVSAAGVLFYGLGGLFSVDHDVASATPATARGLQARVVNLANSTFTDAVAAQGVLWNYSGAAGGAITTGSVFKGQVANDNATATMGTVYGLNLSGWTNTGTIANSYGIYLDTSIDVGATTKYALYSSSTSPSCLAGKLGIGITAPAVNIHGVADDATTNGVVEVGRFTHSTTGTAANNIGTALTLYSEDASGNVEEAARIAALFPTANHATQVGRLDLTALEGSTGFHLWSSGVAGLWTGTSLPATELQVISIVTSSPRGIMSSQYNTGTDGARFHMRKARGTLTSPTVIVSGDTLGRLVASGYDGSNYLEMAAMELCSEGTIAATRIPTRFSVWTATNAAPSVLTERLRIDSAGEIAIRTPNAWLSSVDNAGTGTLNWFRGNASDQIEVGASLVAGYLEAPEDAGAITLFDLPISSTPIAGTEMSATLRLDATNVLQIYGEASGAGAVQNQQTRAWYVGGATNSVRYPFRVRHNTSGTPAAGIGVGLQFEQLTAAANYEIGAAIEAVTTDVTGASEDFDLVVKLMAAGAAITEALRILSTGKIKPAGGYQSTDGTDGATAGPFTVVSSIQVKNGLVTTLTGT